MSQDNNKQEEPKNPPTDIDDDDESTNVTITIDKSKVEEELRQELEKEKQEKIKANEELQKLNDELQELRDAGEQEKKEYEDKLNEMEQYKEKIADLALKEFNRRKSTYVDRLSKTGLEEEKIDEIMGSIKQPEDLDNAEIYLSLMSEKLGQAQEELKRLEEEKEKDEGNEEPSDDDDQDKLDQISQQMNKQNTGGGVVELPPNPNSEGIYKDHREAIDDLYKRSAMGDEKAQRELQQMWRLAIQKIKDEKVKANVTQCPQCNGGIEEGADRCPYCGFDPQTYRYRGSIWS